MKIILILKLDKKVFLEFIARTRFLHHKTTEILDKEEEELKLLKLEEKEMIKRKIELIKQQEKDLKNINSRESIDKKREEQRVELERIKQEQEEEFGHAGVHGHDSLRGRPRCNCEVLP